MSRWMRLACCGTVLLVCAAMGGCSTYVIKGNVVSGAISDMTYVEVGDARLREPPLTNVRITVERDPDKLSRQMVGTDLSDAHGRFVVSLEEFGAGWMDETWMVRASKPGFKSAASRLRLEPKHKSMRLLIILAPGLSSVPREEEDLMEQYREYR